MIHKKEFLQFDSCQKIFGDQMIQLNTNIHLD